MTKATGPIKQKPKTEVLARILVSKAEVVSIDSVLPYPSNPRRGNVSAVAASLKENGQFRPLIVQRSTKYILGGNHTWQGMKLLGWQECSVTFIDVPDDEAARIVLADNRTSDLATYDAETLANILGAIRRPHVGTGYSREDISAISRASVSDIGIDLSEIYHPPVAKTKETAQDRKRTKKFTEPEENLIDNAEATTESVYDLKDETLFSSTHPMGIPDLRLDMMLDKLPDPLKTWAGSGSREDAETFTGHWLYNYGIDSTSGMKDASKMILAFYAWDQWFEQWWETPAAMMTKTLNAGIEMAVTPNFSQFPDMPGAFNLWSIYKSRWLGRYFQEIGVKIIPDVDWLLGDRDWLDAYVLPGIPKQTPIISIQIQHYEKEKGSIEAARQIATDIRYIVKQLDPGLLFVYAGKPGKALLDTFAHKLPCPVHWQPNRLIDLSNYQKKLQKQKQEMNERVRIK